MRAITLVVHHSSIGVAETCMMKIFIVGFGYAFHAILKIIDVEVKKCKDVRDFNRGVCDFLTI